MPAISLQPVHRRRTQEKRRQASKAPQLTPRQMEGLGILESGQPGGQNLAASRSLVSQPQRAILENGMNTNASPETAAIAAAIPLTVRQSILVPLDRLVLAPHQVRKTAPSKEGIAEMAAMLQAQGQLAALHVSAEADSERYQVVAGGRRLRGFQLLAKEGRIAQDFPVECKLVDAVDGTVVGLMENISQEAMHPADEFEAFRVLHAQGRSAESIATQYGVTVLHVLRRLKLAGLAPELMKAYRKGDIQLDQVMALVALEDPKRQVMLYKSLPHYARTASHIRRTIAQDEISDDDQRVKLVGLAAYSQAGGAVREDLFSENGTRYLTDPLLLDMLVAEAFEAQAAQLRAKGWQWVDVHLDYGYAERMQYFAMPVKHLPESPVHTDKRLALEAQLNSLHTQIADSEDDDDGDHLHDQMVAVEAQHAALAEQLIDKTAAEKDLAGVVLTLAGGKIKRLENLGRGADYKTIMAALKAREGGAAAHSGESIPQAGAGQGEAVPSGDAPEGDDVPERLMLNLTAHRTAAIQASLLSHHEVALAVLAHRMACSMFDTFAGHEHPIKVSLSSAWHRLANASATVGTSRAADVVIAERSRMEALLPPERSDWLAWFIEQPLEVTLSMIVLGTAETVDAMQSRAKSNDLCAGLAKAVALDMRAWWEPTASNYLDLVPKAKLMEAVSEAKSVEAAKDMPKLKKTEAIAFAAQALSGTGWLPVPLR